LTVFFFLDNDDDDDDDDDDDKELKEEEKNKYFNWIRQFEVMKPRRIPEHLLDDTPREQQPFDAQSYGRRIDRRVQ
jgi:hypothetical protein